MISPFCWNRLHASCQKLVVWIARLILAEIVDDANKARIAKDKQQAQQLGTIRVRVYRATWQDVDKPVWLDPRNKILSTALMALNKKTDKLSIAEKALKGRTLSHGFM